MTNERSRTPVLASGIQNDTTTSPESVAGTDRADGSLAFEVSLLRLD